MFNKIVTSFFLAPVPHRDWDWFAWREDDPETQANGASELEAITRLLEMEDE